MRALLLLLLGLGSPAFGADFVQPNGAPEIFVPSYNVTVSVFAVQTPVGHGIGIFEKRDKSWYLCGQCLVSPELPTMDAAIREAGGAAAYVASKRAAINMVLASRYPASGIKKSDAATESVNEALAGAFILRIVDGVPQLSSR